MKASKIKIIQEYIKQHQPNIISILNVKKKKDNFIVNCNTYYKSNIQVPLEDINGYHYNETNTLHNISEQKTYIIPIKDINFPKKRKLPKIKKIHRS